MKMIRILGYLPLIGLPWAAGQKVDFILPQQERSRAIHVETHKEKLEIEGHEVNWKCTERRRVAPSKFGKLRLHRKSFAMDL